MIREEHLEFCKICKNKSFDINKGIICGLTKDIASFEESCPNFKKIEGSNFVENKKKREADKKRKAKEKRKENRKEKRKLKEKISLGDLYLIVSGALIAVFFNRMLVYANSLEKSGLFSLIFFIPFLLTSIITLFFREEKGKQLRFFGDIKFRLLHALIISLFTVVYTILINKQYSDLFSAFFGLIILIFLVSFVGFLCTKLIVLIFRKERRFQNYLYKRVIITILSLLVLLGMLEKDFLINRETVYWKSDNSLTWDNFRGYPNYLSKYSAAITSDFDYTFIGDSLDTIKIEAFSQPHHSWVKGSTKDSEYVLRHENYHFNVSELIARKFRKEILELNQASFNKKTVKTIYRKYRNELLSVQNKYDTDTDHGLLIEKQKDWEYLVDSLLNKYALYGRSIVCLNKVDNIDYKYYRQIEIDPQYNIIGKFAIDSADAQKLEHYCFYYTNKKVSKIEFRNKSMLTKDKFFGASVILIESENDNLEWQFFDSRFEKTFNDDEVHKVRIERNFDKKEITRTNFDNQNNIIIDKSGIAKIIWELDYKKRREVARYYNADNNQITDNDGFYIIKFRYDKDDNVIEKANFNNKNELLEANDEIAFMRYEYDINRNVIQVKSFNSQKESVPYNGFIAESNFTYDLYGNITCESYKKADDSPYFRENRTYVSYYKYDKFLNQLEERHYGTNKNLKIDENGSGKIRRRCDSIGNILEGVNYDAYDNYLNDNDNYCKSTYEYDSLNRLSIQVQYYADSSDKLHHFKTIYYEYDSLNNQIAESYFKEDGNLRPDSTGSSIVRFEYDKKGNLTKVENYDENGNFKAVTEGVSIFRYEYDNNNNKIKAAYYDVNDQLTNTVENIAYDTYIYNSKNQLVGRSYYDKKGLLTKNSDSVKVIKWVKDINDNVLEERYFNDKGKLTPNKTGIVISKFYYDNHKNKIKVEYYDKRMQLVMNVNNGIAIIKYKYDDENNLIEAAYYDRENKLKELPDGYAKDKLVFDKQDRLIRREYYSKYNQPTVTSFGYAAFDWEYDKNDNVIAEIYRDENNELIEDDDGFAFYNWIYNRNGESLNSYGFTANHDVNISLNYGEFNSSVKSIYFYPEYYGYSKRGSNVQTTYFDNGQKESEVCYINGKPDGRYTSWYETGEIESEIMYDNGMRIGKMTEYYKSGQTWRVMTYENNTLIQNSQITYNENGKVYTMYVDNELQEWDEEGNMLIEEG